MEERLLIHAAQKGDLEAFNQLVEMYQDLAYNQAVWLLGDSEAASDITQDSFLKAYQSIASFRGESLRSWLLRIVTNACYDELRRLKRRQTWPLDQSNPDGEENESHEWLIDSDVSIEGSVEQAELSALLRRHLEALPEKYRSVAVLVDVLELDYWEAAEALGVPIGTVKSRLARARSQLRGQLLGATGFLTSEMSAKSPSIAV